MKKNTFKSFLIIASGLFSSAIYAQSNVAINSTGALGNTSAVLDLNTGNTGTQGLLAPNVSLANVNNLAPVVGAGAPGLLVYSTTAPIGGNGIGFYYWDGGRWQYVMNGAGSSLSGNGAANFLARWINPNTLGLGIVQDNAVNVGISSPPMAGTMLTVAGGASNNGINGTSTDVTSGTYGVHGNAMTGLDGYLSYIGTINGGGQSVTNASGYFTSNVAGGDPFAAVSTGACTSAAVQGLSDVWHGGFFATGIGAASGVIGYNDSLSGTSTGNGVIGVTLQSAGFGVEGLNFNSNSSDDAVGVFGAGSGSTESYFTAGEGVMGNGVKYGVIGYADGASDTTAGGFFENSASYSFVGATIAAMNYKVIGNGVASTIVKSATSGKNVTLFCPEAPEVLFQDYGQGQLANGKVHISLDPTYSKNVTVNEKHPLRVIITLNDACPNTVYVTNRTATGFDVIENNSGNSNASFTYEVVANRADEMNKNGTKANYADARFPVAPSYKALKKAVDKSAVISNTKQKAGK